MLLKVTAFPVKRKNGFFVLSACNRNFSIWICISLHPRLHHPPLVENSRARHRRHDFRANTPSSPTSNHRRTLNRHARSKYHCTRYTREFPSQNGVLVEKITHIRTGEKIPRRVLFIGGIRVPCRPRDGYQHTRARAG